MIAELCLRGGGCYSLRMRRIQRTDCRPGDVNGLLAFGHDARPGVRPLTEHNHIGTEVCYIASGEVVWIAAGRQRMHLVGGMISVIPPVIAHHGEMNAIAPSDLYWTEIDVPRLVPSLPAEMSAPLVRGKPYVAMGSDAFQRLFDRIVSESAARPVGWRTAVQSQVALLALEAARLSPTFRRGSQRVPPEPIAQAVRLLAQNLEQPPAICDLARQVGLGPTRFHALFRRAIGMTPRDYLGRLRLREAQRALRETDEEITAIALRLGYPSGQYFATAFRRYTGLTPRGYRTYSPRRSRKKLCMMSRHSPSSTPATTSGR